jgi:hypothetical protein
VVTSQKSQTNSQVQESQLERASVPAVCVIHTYM